MVINCPRIDCRCRWPAFYIVSALPRAARGLLYSMSLIRVLVTLPNLCYTTRHPIKKY